MSKNIFMRLTLLNQIIKFKNKISDALECIQTWIEAHSYFLISMTIMCIMCQQLFLRHPQFQSCDIFHQQVVFQHSGLSLLCHTNPGNAFQLVFKVRLNTPLNSTVQGSNETNQTTCATAHRNSTKKPTKIISIYIYILESYTQAC